MAQKETYYRAEIKYENVPLFCRQVYGNEYMRHRNEVVDIFNAHISKVNDAWAQTGKTAAFGPYAEDINPEYAQFVNDRIQPEIDKLNENLNIVNYRLSECCDIEGYIPLVKDSKIWVVFYPVQ